MKKLILIFLLSMTLVSSRASHIVGGEFELIHLFGNTYQLNMILYFDELNGAPGAQDPSVTIRIFRKSDNAIILNALTLGLTSVSDVEYTQLACSNGEIVTDRLFYTTTLTLSPAIYNDPQGYYIAWERCCRNYQITNIFSDPPGGSHFAGQAFYLEFPPVVKDGQPFINNSPRLFPPLNDFACPRIPYYVDFAGVDDDGDSLVYSLVTPLNTFTADALPFPNPPGLPRPGPYPEVEWKPGFGLHNILNGLTNLEISEDGFLTVTPNSTGLYVFAVRCEEFRDGVKIGEVRRDFQMLVVDACPVPVPPVIVGRELDDVVFGTTGNLSVSFDNTVPDEERCFEVRVTDPSSLLPDDNNQENIRIRAIALSFKKSINEILPVVTTATISNGGEAIFKICFPSGCPFTENGIFEIGIVAYDDACALPLTDTLKVWVYIEPPPNQPPQFNNPGGLTNIVETLEEGDPLHVWPLQATDADGDVLKYRLVPVGFTLPNVGMSFTPPPLLGQQPGPLNKQLSWDPKCDVYDFTQKTNFKLYFIIEDLDQCLFTHADTATFDLTINLPGNNDPLINNNLDPGNDTLEITRKIYGAPVQINVTGQDDDLDDVIVLRGSGIGFSPSAYGVSFPKVSGNGTIATQFSWPLTCSNIDLEEKDIFEFNLQVVDSTNKCGFYKADTLHLIVHVEPPDNEPPDLSITSDNPNRPLIDGSISITLGDSIELTLTGTDSDAQPRDLLTLELLSQSGNVEPEGYTFLGRNGEDPLQEAFTWNPNCSIFENRIFVNDYTFRFLLSDNRCFNEKADTVTLHLTIRDVERDDDFLPPNFFSPNHTDNLNAFFAMVEYDEVTGEFVDILPEDNCTGEFVNIRIYDRWGKQVFESSNRDFKWFGEDMPVGVYYYVINYTHRDYKGMVNLRL